MVEWGERDGSGAAERCVGGAVFEGQGVLFVLCGARDGDGDGKGARFERFAISIDSFFVLICFSTANGTSDHDRGHSCESRHVMDRHSRWYMYSFEAPALSAFASFARNVLRSAVARIA